MKDIDIWFTTLSKKEKLIVLIYYKTRDYEMCHKITVEELIVFIEFPQENFDNSNSECPVITLHDFHSLSDDMILQKWNEISTVGKEQILLNFEKK